MALCYRSDIYRKLIAVDVGTDFDALLRLDDSEFGMPCTEF